jgi:deoxyribodipyrimidine photo-lyase
MALSTIPDGRVKRLNEREPREGRYVLYWMQQSQRAETNHALEFALQRANERGKPLLVVFGLTDDDPEANARHYRFMLEGLAETQEALRARKIALWVRAGPPDKVALTLAEEADVVVCDRGYLRHQRAWRERVAREARCAVYQVETDVVVPVEVASGKAEVAARTFRPKQGRHIDEYLVALPATPVAHSSLELGLEGLDLRDVDALLARLKLDTSVAPVKRFRGGIQAAKRALRRFVDERLACYAQARNQPHRDCVSGLSMYLHFGQISPLDVALAVREATADAGDANTGSYLDELLVRRELAMNYVYYTPNYDRYEALPAWARRTLEEHRGDKREHLYTLEQLEAAETHDPYWNAAMLEMRETGYMHNYMRMYWGKQLLAWTADPEEAYARALWLNNRYFLDGRDANSYANVAWCFGLHDRPWPERAVFGKVRSMTRGGLERKTDPEAYVAKVERLVAEERG